MANKTEELNVNLTIKQVESGDVLKDMEENDQLGANEIIITKTDTEVPMMPVGSIFMSAIPQTDARVHLLDGSTISQKGVYETFANLIKALEASGQPITYKDDDQSTANDKFNNDVSKTGNCGKFIIDDKNGTIRLPKITTFIQGLSDITNIGSSLQAGLPNITSKSSSYTQICGWTGGGSQTQGAMYGGDTGYTPAGGSYGRFIALDLDASRSSSIYGKSSTVQPNATRYPYYIVLASGYKSSQVVDIDNIMNEVNKLNQDYIVVNQKTTTGGFRKWASGYKEFWGQTNTSGVADHDIPFPETFIKEAYSVSISPVTNNTASDIIASKVEKGTDNMIVRMRYRSTSGQGNATVNVTYFVAGY